MDSIVDEKCVLFYGVVPKKFIFRKKRREKQREFMYCSTPCDSIYRCLYLYEGVTRIEGSGENEEPAHGNSQLVVTLTSCIDLLLCH